MKQQRRGRAIAMTPAEVDVFLAEERVCRLASLDAGGAPDVAPLWFVWDGRALWINSLVRSQRWANVLRDPRVAVVIDAGVDYAELRGVELHGKAEPVGDVPRSSEPDAVLDPVEAAFALKYRPDRGGFEPDGRHAWLRLVPAQITSWDFRKLPA